MNKGLVCYIRRVTTGGGGGEGGEGRERVRVCDMMLVLNFGNSLKMGTGVTKRKKTRKGSLGEVDCHLSKTVDIIFFYAKLCLIL